MNIPSHQIAAAVRRWNERAVQRQRNLRLIEEGRPLAADTPARVEKFLHRRGLTGRSSGERRELRGAEPSGLERVLGTNDLVGVAFFERGLQVARTVGRIWIGVRGGQAAGYGTGFMISPRLLMTNHHVLEQAAIARTSLVEFDYTVGISGALMPSTTFVLEPQTFFKNNEELDYAVVAVQPTSSNARELAGYLWNPLIEEEGKAIISQWMNIIQHPNGEPKQLGLRENQLIDVLENFLHYRTDTAPGSSGSGVFNDRWELVGLHHSGVPKTNEAGQVLAIDGRVWRQDMGDNQIHWIANEGVRISKIIAHIRGQHLSVAEKRLFDECFTTPPEPTREATPAPAPVRHDAPLGQSVSLAADGTATWTIPVSVSVKLGGFPAGAPVQPGTDIPIPTERPSEPSSNGVPHSTDRETVLAAAVEAFRRRADVLNVRWGYVFKNGWITEEPALVVTVRQKRTPAAMREAGISLLPDRLQGYPVEVTNPTIEELVAAELGAPRAEALFAPPAVLRHEITYAPPAGAQLRKVTDEQMRVVAHISPDAGWKTLAGFLEATRQRLTIGMYDFGAPHIFEAIKQVGGKRGFRKLTLVIQPGESVGSGTKANDLTDSAVVEGFAEELGAKFESAWVKIGRVNGWVSSSYHIKVAVRDGTAFWMSSGNWQSSNQPDADPLAENPRRSKWLREYNRDWHAIVEHRGLAETYEQFLQHDFANNRAHSPDEALGGPELLFPEGFFLADAAEQVASTRYFDPFDDTRAFTVTPLLSPDNYHAETLALVRGATTELLIQNQTFKAPKADHQPLRELLAAVKERQDAGVPVRIIFRVLMAADARANLEALQDFGIDTANVRVQKNCHTKGIIVDRQRVLLGSQNWSNDGVSVNRDASLLFEDTPLAEYFAGIFEHDWEHLAKSSVGRESAPVGLAANEAATPQGMVRISWKEYLEMM